MFILLSFFVLGIISDVLIVIYTQSVTRKRPVLASISAIFITLMAYLVLSKALETHTILYIVAFSLGNGLGTFLSVRFDGKR